MGGVMQRRVFRDTIVSIENARSRKVLWIEEISDDDGKIKGYAVKKSIRNKNDVDHLKELKHLKPNSEKN